MPFYIFLFCELKYLIDSKPMIVINLSPFLKANKTNMDKYLFVLTIVFGALKYYYLAKTSYL